MKASLYFFLSSLAFDSCTPVNSNIGMPQVYQYPEQHLMVKEKSFILSSMLQVPSQRFTITSYNDTILTGAEGTEITLKPRCVFSKSQELAALPFYIELKELYSKSALLKERACTVSNGALLESDGSLYINASNEAGETFMISCEHALSIRIPKTIRPGMVYFEGSRDPMGNMNWNLTDSIVPIASEGFGFVENSEQNWEEASFNSETYSAAEQYFFSVKKFGYINCDRFYEDSTRKTDLIAETILPNKGKLFESHTYIVFDSLFSILPVYQDKDGYWKSKDVPVGASVTYISIQKQGDALYYGSIKTQIGASRLRIPLHRINPEELQKILDLSL